MANHLGSVEGTLAGDTYNAACVCGWKGQERDTEEEAKADLGRHYDEVERER